MNRLVLLLRKLWRVEDVKAWRGQSETSRCSGRRLHLKCSDDLRGLHQACPSMPRSIRAAWWIGVPHYLANECHFGDRTSRGDYMNWNNGTDVLRSRVTEILQSPRLGDKGAVLAPVWID